MGLSRAEYLSLIAAVDLVLDPVTEDGGGLETALVPTLEALMIGTPVVTLRPDEDVRGWDRMQPTSSAAGVIQAVGGDAMASRCVARTPQAYAVLAAALLKRRELWQRHTYRSALPCEQSPRGQSLASTCALGFGCTQALSSPVSVPTVRRAWTERSRCGRSRSRSSDRPCTWSPF